MVPPRMSAAMDGRRQAHMDVLVAVLGGTIATLALLATNSRRKKPPKPKWLHPYLLSIVILCDETRQQTAVIEV
jgi:hypothetical protein